MRRILLWLMVIQLSALFGAQFEIINEIEENPMHMGLAMMDDELKNDNRGELGALVIINCGLKDVLFQNSAMKISQVDKTGAYWLVMKQRAKHFIISREGFPNYKYDFPSPLQSGTVYKMTIDEKNKLPDEITLIITSNQSNAKVFVDDQEIGTTDNKVFSGMVALGTREIELRKSGYTTKKVTYDITLDNNRFEINLDPAFPAAVSITTEPQGATVYIDNVLFGISPKSSFFTAGTYPLKIEKESYATINEEITITEPETKKNYIMQDIRATLTIKTNPQAIVIFNGTEYNGGLKDLKLNPQSITLRVEEEFCETINESYTLKENEVKIWELYPKNIAGTITINTNPEAEIIVNNTAFNGSIKNKKYLPGNITIKVSQTFCETITENYNLSSNENKVFDLYPQNISGNLTINTNPNAKVVINGEIFTGSIKSKKYLPAQMSITVTQEFCNTIKETYNLKSNETKTFDLYPQDISGYLTIKTNNDAKIFLNKKEYQKVNRLRLIPQVLEIRVSQAKADDLERVITLKTTDDISLELYPEIKKSQIVVVTIPTTASIELTGDAGEHYTATGRKSFNDIPIGIYELVVTNEGYKTHKETIKLNVDNTIQKQISLEEGSDVPEGFVFVQGGSFQMGSNSGDDDEKPVHPATISDFNIGKYEVTQAEWQVVMGNNPSRFKGDNNPVEQVSWFDAVDFCNKKSTQEGLNPVYSGSGDNIKCDFSKNGYRLPTEAEWEYAARGGNKSQGYKYSGSDNLDEFAWYWSNSSRDSNSQTYPVGGKKPNELGIYDMSGNVYEWCWDRYEGYNNTKQTDPVGPTTGSHRVIRGGSWGVNATDCRLAGRDGGNPTLSYNSVGFRVARSSN